MPKTKTSFAEVSISLDGILYNQKMLPSLTAIKKPKHSTFPSFWQPMLLGVSLLLLSACHSQTNLSVTQPSKSTHIQILRTITLGPNIPQTAELFISLTHSASFKAQLISVPQGLNVKLQAPIYTRSGNIILPLTFNGSAPDGSVVSLKINANATTTQVDLPIFRFEGRKIAAKGLSNQYQANRICFFSDGSLQLSAKLSGNATEQKSLVEWSAKRGFRVNTFGSLRPGESISSHTIDSNGKRWIAVRGMTQTGSYLISQHPSGIIKTYQNIGATADNINDLTPTTNGHIWFTQYQNDRVAELNPANQKVKTHPVHEEAESLIKGDDNKLYYAQFYARPAIVQLDPSTGVQKAFPLGIPERSEPRALTAAAGQIWYIEPRSRTVWHLNPQTKKHTKLTLPLDAHPNQLAASKQSIWIADPQNARLYTNWKTKHKDTFIGISIPQSTNSGYNNGPNALSIAPDGTLWYEAGGVLMNLVAPAR